MVNRLRVTRIAQGLKQKDIAKSVGRSAPYIAILEKMNTSHITLDLRKRLAGAMGVEESDLFGEIYEGK